MNKEQYINWIKNRADLPDIMSNTSEVEKYPYCMLFHLMRSMKINTIDNKSVLAVLHPSRKRLQTLLLQQDVDQYNKKENTVKDDNREEKINIIKEAATEFRDKEDLMDILQKRLAELNTNSDTGNEDQNEQEFLFEPQPSVSLDELVEKFNKFPPKISFNPVDFEDEKNYRDLGKSSVFDRSNIISETLAELYCVQGAYDKALKIYEALKLKYPEKSDTFAEIIKNINAKNNI